jgi:hypothetical protein
MSELFPAKSIAVEVIACNDPAREFEFNSWHDKVRVPYLRQMDGIVDVYRYRDVQPDLSGEFKRFTAASGDHGRYLTLYRINDPDPWRVVQRIGEEERSRGGLIDCAEIQDLTVWDFVACRRTIRDLDSPPTRLPDGMPEALLLYYSNTEPGRAFEHDDWWLFTHAHDLLETPGLVECSRYRTLNPEPTDREAKTLNFYEIDAEDPGAVLLRVLQQDRDVRRPEGRFSTFAREGEWHGTGLYRHWDLM